MTKQRLDILIVGGGVMGCAIATHLLQKDNCLNITIVEKDSTYVNASTVRSDGNARLQFNLKENIEISLYGMEVLSAFHEEFATAAYIPVIDFHQQGNIFVVGNEISKKAAQQGLAQQASLGAESYWITPQKIQELHPLFNPQSCIGATYGPRDGTMSPLDILLGYRHKAVELGATIIEAEVTTLLKNGAAITGAQLSTAEKLHANIVVNAAGPWAGQLTQTIAVEIPVVSIKRQVYSVEVDAHFDHILPMILLPTGQYCIHEGGGHFITGGALPTDPETYDDFSWSRERFEENLWEKLIHYFPTFDRLKIINGWAGFYAVNTFDGNAILGEWPNVKGLFLVNGFSGHGFQQCHAVGRYLAERILGQEPVLDLSIFSPQRILDNAPVFENPLRII